MVICSSIKPMPGVQRSSNFIFIHLTAANTRNTDQKQAFFKRTAELLGQDPGIRIEDIVDRHCRERERKLVLRKAQLKLGRSEAARVLVEPEQPRRSRRS